MDGRRGRRRARGGPGARAPGTVASPATAAHAAWPTGATAARWRWRSPARLTPPPRPRTRRNPPSGTTTRGGSRSWGQSCSTRSTSAPSARSR
eukprot:985711-Prorocentrum_minimum.AAC.1